MINSSASNEYDDERQKDDQVKSDHFWSFHEDLIAKSRQLTKNNEMRMADDLKYYLHQPPIKMDESPLKYWMSNMHSPLKSIALKYLSIIATSVPSERLFSQAGNILTEERNRLSGEHLQHLLFLNSLSAVDWLL